MDKPTGLAPLHVGDIVADEEGFVVSVGRPEGDAHRYVMERAGGDGIRGLGYEATRVLSADEVLIDQL